jgi:hypothetical protein
MAAEQHPDLRLDLEDWSVAKLKGIEHLDWRLAEDLPVVAVEESVTRCLGRDTFLDELHSSVSPIRAAPPLFAHCLLCCIVRARGSQGRQQQLTGTRDSAAGCSCGQLLSGVKCWIGGRPA